MIYGCRRNPIRFFTTESLLNSYLRLAIRAKNILIALAVLVLLGSCGGGSGEGLDQTGRPVSDTAPTNPPNPTADFQFLQDTVFTPVCTVCHAGGAAPVGLKLDSANSYAMLVGVSSVQVPALLRVAPGDPDNSYLIQKLEGTAAIGAQMPLGGPPVSTDTISLFRQWISAGALPPDQSTPPQAPPTVVSVAPADGASLTASPISISAVFSQDMDAALVSDVTYTLESSGGDGTFGDGNESLIAADSINTANGREISLEFTNAVLPDEVYQARLVGSGATALANTAGIILDGDGDGTAGGNFVWQFTVDTSQAAALPTWRWIQDNVFTAVCTQCHISGGIAAFLALDEANSFANTVNVPSTGVPTIDLIEPGSPDTSYLIQKLEGTAAAGSQMPLGLAPLDTDVIAAIRTWVANGVPLEPGDPMPDVSSPVVTLQMPVSPVVGVITLAADATDNVEVTEARFLLNGTLLGSDSLAPFEYTWDSTVLTNGPYTLIAEADDAAGNVGVSAAIDVTVDNPLPPDTEAPVISLTNPGTPLSGVINLGVTANDNVGVTTVRFFVDGVLLSTDTTAPFDAVWDTSSETNGTHTITAEADDAAGNTGTSVAVTVTVDNGLPPDIEAPVVSISDPGAPVAGVVSVTVNASDNVGVTTVRLFVDGTLVGTDNAAPYLIDWNSTTVADGTYTLTAEADDAAGNTGLAVSIDITVTNVVGPEATWRWIQDNIFTPQCVVCHVSGGVADFLPLNEEVSYAALVNAATTEGGPPFRVLPGDPDNSSLVQRLEGTLTPSMPLGGGLLPADEILVVRQWILDGAPPEPTVDVTPPSVSLVSPGTTVAGIITLVADASDDVAIASVRIFVDGSLINEDSVAPYEATWDTTQSTDGVHMLTAEAEDSAGNITTSLTIEVTVNNSLPADMTAPEVQIQPVSNPLSGEVNIAITATDNVAVTGVSLSVDGNTFGTDLTSPYLVSWNTLTVSNGVHTLVATATDAAGNVGTSSPVSVNVSNTAAVINVAITAPTVVVDGDDFAVVANLSNAGVGSDALTATLTFSPANLLRIENPGASQQVAAIPNGGQIPVNWLMRADDVGVATIVIAVTDLGGTVSVQEQVTITVTN